MELYLFLFSTFVIEEDPSPSAWSWYLLVVSGLLTTMEGNGRCCGSPGRAAVELVKALSPQMLMSCQFPSSPFSIHVFREVKHLAQGLLGV